MRALALCLISLTVACGEPASAQTRLATKPLNANETRYFTSIDGLMDGNADVVLKEIRQGKTVTSAVLDVCYPADRGSDRKDRFVVTLTPSGNTLSGTTQSIADKLPVSVKLTRKQTSDTFEFKGQISVGQTVTDVSSTDNSDLSEKEFQDSLSTDDGIAVAPKDFTEVSPESLAVKIKLEAAPDYLKSLKGENAEVSLNSLNVSCEALRSGQQTIYLNVDPDRAAAFVAKAKTSPGVVSAGWSSGLVEMDRTIRFPAADWRDGGKLNRDKIAAGIADVMEKVLSAKLASSKWTDVNGKLKLSFKRPSQVFPSLELTEVLDITALVGPDKPGGGDSLMLWVSGPAATTIDESSGAKLNLADPVSIDEEGERKPDAGGIEALVRAFKAQRWDADRSAWK